MAKIIGLDLGTNSIGWAVVNNEKKCIEAAGSRIIPMDGDRMSKFESGGSVSYTEDRTRARGARRLRERYLLRRERLLLVLNIMGFLPEHYASQLNRYGKLPVDAEPKLAWREGKDGKQEFLFKDSFGEMVQEFRAAGMEGNLPYDWTIYYLRKKALSRPISKEELSWVLLQFNQKRGYYQLRGKMDELDTETENQKEEKEYCELLVTNIDPTGEKDKNGNSKYNIYLENGWVYPRTFRTKPDWEGKTRSFIATFKLDKDGKRKNEQLKLSAPSEDDWGLLKIKTEHDIESSKLTVGEFIYNTLLHNPSQKIIGEKVRVVKRELYLKELHRILDKQREFIPELNDSELYNQCIEVLYPSNDAYRNNIANRDFTYLLADDILFYQRPLKSKTSLIADCPYEKYIHTTKDGKPRIKDGKPVVKPCKCIAKSHPLFQEFRLWQFLSNLRIYRNDKNVTSILLPNNDAYANLYDYLSKQKSINQKGILKYFNISKSELPYYRWFKAPDHEEPTGETRSILLGGLRKAGINDDFLTEQREVQLWHILYSVDDPKQYEHALRTFASKQGLLETQRDTFIEAFRRLTIYKEKDYGSYSAKAISRLLPVMRRGKYWSADAIDIRTRKQIEHLISGEADDVLTATARMKLSGITDIAQCQGLPTWQACYLVYGRHSEAADAKPWRTPEDIDAYLDTFRHNSLNNPVVEQVVTETLRVVHDIWQQYGKPDEIHIELSRELKKTKSERESLSQSIKENEATNQRLRLMLLELMNPDCQVDNVRPLSPSQMELLKVYEDGVMRRPEKDIYESENEKQAIEDIRKRFAAAKNHPTHSEMLRYKLWLDQKYISPYTGHPIPLGKLFTPAYQIEHIIPQSRWFDDSLSNKVICEAEVNQLKDRELGHEFIVNHHGERVQLSLGGIVEILTVEAYEKLVGDLFSNNRAKRMKLMLDDIPEDFNARQMNDSRHISRLMMHLLSNIVRTEDEEGNREESVVSKNVIPCNGSITDRLKQEWGIGDVWNRIILPRFERLNTLTNSTDYTTTTANGHTIPTVPIELRQGFNKKRIDHRHHAMDALVIACCTRDHVNLLNNESARESSIRYDLQHKLRKIEYYPDKEGKRHEKFTDFIKPWPSFTEDTYHVLQGIIVSFKQNLRVINKTANHYKAIRNGKHVTCKQEKGDSWAIRKPLHKDTVFGEVNLQLTKPIRLKKALSDVNNIVSRELKEKIKEKKAMGYTDKQIIEYLNKNKDVWSEVVNGNVEVYYYTKDTGDRYFATRKSLLEVVGGCTTMADAENKIKSITDSGISSILRAHLAAEGNNPLEAFSAEGLERMNKNIKALNGGKTHQPIKRVRKYEKSAKKFSVGENYQKNRKYVEAADNTNLFFVIYTDSKGMRNYTTMPLKPVIDLQKQYHKEWKQHIADYLQLSEECKVLYIISPDDLVYIPFEDEQPTLGSLSKTRIYKVVSCDDPYISCIPVNSARPIVNKVEYESLNKMKTTLDKKYMIREKCIPIQVDRLGNITHIG